jgi:hypothetical protein
MLKKKLQIWKSKEKVLHTIKESTYQVVGNGWATGGPHGDEGVELGGRQVEHCSATAQAHTATQVVRSGIMYYSNSTVKNIYFRHLQYYYDKMMLAHT